MKRRLYISALLVGTCVALAARPSLAQDAPTGEAKPGDKPAEGEKPADAQKPAEGDKPAEGQPATEQKPAEGDKPAEAAKPAEAPAAEAPAAEQKPAEQPAAAAEPAPAAPAEAPAAPSDDLPEAGYIPGYRRHPALGLSVWTPPTPSVPGGMTVPYGAPAPADTWSFNYTGYFSAAVKAAIRDRQGRVRAGQSETVLKTPVETPDAYGAFTGTGSVLGSWVSMTFEYGNKIATAHASISTWNPSRPTSYTQVSSQYFVDAAYLTFRLPQIDKLRIGWNVGAFGFGWGQLGQYSNLYGGGFLGANYGVGEQLSAEYDLTDTLVLQLDHGFFGRYGKAPQGIRETQANGWPDASDPAPWSQAARVGVVRNGDTVMQAGLIFASNWAQDDMGRDVTDPVDVPIENPIDETNPPDPSMKMIGFESRIRGQWYHFGLAAGYATYTDAYALHGLSFWVAGDGENFTNNWGGVESGGNGNIWGVGSEVTLGWGALARNPEPFWGDGWNAVTVVAAQYGKVSSDGPNPDRDRSMYKFAIDNEVKLIKWIAFGVRFDRVVSDTSKSETTFHVIAPRIEFQSNWNSHETITLQYAHWFYGDEPPVISTNQPNDDLDKDVISFGFGFWW